MRSESKTLNYIIFSIIQHSNFQNFQFYFFVVVGYFLIVNDDVDCRLRTNKFWINIITDESATAWLHCLGCSHQHRVESWLSPSAGPSPRRWFLIWSSRGRRATGFRHCTCCSAPPDTPRHRTLADPPQSDHSHPSHSLQHHQHYQHHQHHQHHQHYICEIASITESL